jgi:hypothetical protein
MTSQKQLAANRRNARRSTGPRTAQGKEKSRLNSLRHGFSSAKAVVFTEEMDDLYRSLWEDFDPDAAILAAARAAVVADFELRRVRLARRLLHERFLEAQLLERKNAEATMPSNRIMADLVKTYFQLFPRDRAKLSLTELERYERYERRAFSKRNTALMDLGKLLGKLVGTPRDNRTRW